MKVLNSSCSHPRPLAFGSGSAAGLVALTLLLLPLPLRASDALYRAEIHGNLVSITPPAQVREGHLFVPLEFVQHVLGPRPQGAAPQRQLQFFAHWAQFAVGQTELRTAAGPWTLPVAPFLAHGAVYVPAELLQEALGISLNVVTDSLGYRVVHVDTTGSEVRGVHLETLPDRVRLTLDLTAETVFQWRSLGDSIEIDLPLPAGASETHGVVLEAFENPHLGEVSRSTSDGFTRLQIGVENVGEPLLTALADPPRLVLDLPLTSQPLTPPAPVPGTTPATAPTVPPLPLPPAYTGPAWATRHFLTARGPVDVFVLRVAADDPKWRVRTALAADTVHQRHSVAYICRQNAGGAAINGGFFAAQGPPVGLLVVDGEWICSPILNRTMLAASASGQARMGRWDFQGRVNLGARGSLAVTDLNRNESGLDDLTVYTARWANSLPGDSTRLRLCVSRQGVVVARDAQGGTVDLPDGGYILSARGVQADRLSRVQVGESLHLELGTDPAWPDLWWAVEGGPRLLVNGQIQISSGAECFRPDVCEGAASRSAAAITRSGDLMLVAVESPSGAGGSGVTLHELAEMLQKLGAWNAMNLDGGGSTTVVQNGETINRVRGGSRLVSNALVVVPKAQPAPTVASASRP